MVLVKGAWYGENDQLANSEGSMKNPFRIIEVKNQKRIKFQLSAFHGLVGFKIHEDGDIIYFHVRTKMDQKLQKTLRKLDQKLDTILANISDHSKTIARNVEQCEQILQAFNNLTRVMVENSKTLNSNQKLLGKNQSEINQLIVNQGHRLMKNQKIMHDEIVKGKQKRFLPKRAYQSSTPESESGSDNAEDVIARLIKKKMVTSVQVQGSKEIPLPKKKRTRLAMKQLQEADAKRLAKEATEGLAIDKGLANDKRLAKEADKTPATLPAAEKQANTQSEYKHSTNTVENEGSFHKESRGFSLYFK